MAVEHEALHWVLGVPVRVVSDHPAVLEAAAGAFGSWSPPGGDASAAITLELHVAASGEEAAALPAAEIAVEPGRTYRLRLGGNQGLSDARTGRAVVRVTEALLRQPDVLRHSFLEGMALFLVTQRDRCPLHAAALVEGGRALLLAAPSGSGKSTLTYAAYRAGLQVLAEDTVYVQTGPPVRVWGLPGFLHLLPDAVRFFPELRGRAAARLPNGKVKLAVDLRPRGVPAAPYAERAGICLVSQGPELRVERVPAAQVAAALAGNPAGGFGYFADAMGPAVEAIGAAGCWRLVVPPDPAAAVPALREMIRGL